MILFMTYVWVNGFLLVNQPTVHNGKVIREKFVAVAVGVGDR